jgi:hypothetical protein
MIPRVLEMNEGDDAAYEAFLARHPAALLYASSGYRNLLRDVLNATPRYLYTMNPRGEVDGVLPAFVSPAGDHAPVLNSLPFYGSNGGIVGDCHRESSNRLVERFYDLARETACASATIISSPFDTLEMANWYRSNLEYDAVDERLCQVTSLEFDDNHADNLMASFHQKTRNMIRKSDKVGVQVSVENNMLDFVHDVHVDNMKLIGGIAKPRPFFSLIPNYFVPNKGFRIYVARISGAPAAAVLLFYYNKTVEYFTPVIREEYRRTQALSGAIFQGMCDASRAGFRHWNWGGTWASQDGVYLFKSRWGARDLGYRYFTRIYDASLVHLDRQEVLARYPNFYVLPFSMLQQHA